MDAYAPALRRFCSTHCDDPGARQDLFQEIAIALWTAIPHFRHEASERTWIYRIAQNVAFSEAVRRRRKRNREVPLDSGPVLGRRDNQRRRELLDAIRRLEPIERQLAWLYLEGLSAREIAEVLGIKEENVFVRLTRLRQRLARMLNTAEASNERTR